MRRFAAAVFLLLTVCPAFAAKPYMADVQKQLESHDVKENVKGLEAVLAKADRAPSIELWMASAIALQQQRVEDAAFLFYAGQLRSHLDLARFPPSGKGGDSPAVALGALSQEVGMMVNPAVMRDPRAFVASFARLEKWQPATPFDYEPGWEHGKALTEKAANEIFVPQRADYMRHFKDFATLLSDPEYQSAFRVVQDYNLSMTDEQRAKSAKALQKAQKTMAEIEKKRGIAGFASMGSE